MSTVVVDDHLLLRLLVDNEPPALLASSIAVATTGLWYHRLCRALCDDSVIGSISRQLRNVNPEITAGVLGAVVDLPDTIQLVSLRTLGWPMGRLAHTGTPLNLLSLEALAAARYLSADICLSKDDNNIPLRTAAAETGITVHILD